MDINQDKSDSGKSDISGAEKSEIKLPDITLPKFYLPKPKPSEWPNKIKLKLKEYRRVLQITKKPTKEEFKAIVKASGIGIIIVGLIGFAIHMIVQILHMF